MQVCRFCNHEMTEDDIIEIETEEEKAAHERWWNSLSEKERARIEEQRRQFARSMARLPNLAILERQLPSLVQERAAGSAGKTIEFRRFNDLFTDVRTVSEEPA